MNDEKLMNICEQFIILKYAFHGACKTVSEHIKDDDLRKSLLNITKKQLLKVGLEMCERDNKKESKELFKQLKDII